MNYEEFQSLQPKTHVLVNTDGLYTASLRVAICETLRHHEHFHRIFQLWMESSFRPKEVIGFVEKIWKNNVGNVMAVNVLIMEPISAIWEIGYGYIRHLPVQPERPEF